MRRRSAGARLRGALLSVVMIVLACLAAVPFYYVLVNTFKPARESARSPLGLPEGLHLDNYVDVFDRVPVVQAFANTVVVTAASVTLVLLIGSMASYALVMRSSRLNTALGRILLLALLIPFQTTLIPLYQSFAQVRLVDSRLGLVLLYSGGAVFCYFLVNGYVRSVPMEIIEAARVDGAGPLRIYAVIVLPLVRPILITVGVFQTMSIWNDFIIPNVFISSPDKQTLVLQVYSAVGQFTTDWPSFLTLTVIALLPMVVLFVVLQRHVVAGLLAGSVKG